MYNKAATPPYAGPPSYIASARVINQIPQESCLHQSADELLKFVSELENKTGRIDDLLFGARPEDPDEIHGVAESLQQKIAEACTRVASLCGLAGTIGNKLAGE